MKPTKETGWHTFLDGDGPYICALCRLKFETLELAAATVCQEATAKAREIFEQVLYAIKEVLQTKHEKVTPMSGPDASRRIKQRVDAAEKLVRIQAAIYTLLETDFRVAIEDEAKNRCILSQVTGRKPW